MQLNKVKNDQSGDGHPVNDFFDLMIFFKTKKLFLTRCFSNDNYLQPFTYEIFNKVFQQDLKLLETFLFQIYVYNNSKKKKNNKARKVGISFDLKTALLIERFETLFQ